MIKINLLRDIPSAQLKKEGALGAAGTFVDGTRLAPQAETKELVVKIAAALVPIIIGFGSVSYVESQKVNELKKIDLLIQAKKKEKMDLGPAIRAVDDFKKEKDLLEVQIDTIKTLSRERLRNVKALSALQDIIPEKAWIHHLKIDENKAQIEGSAVDDKTVAEFMQALDANIFFADVKLIKSTEQQTKEGAVKVYSIECKLEGI